MFKQLGLIGCGLMGGSFALAMKRAGLVKHVVGYSKSPSTVIQAQKMGVGAQVRTMTPEAHDAAFASVSHLPHLLAFSAYLAVAHQPEGKLFLELAGPGFRDFTRIAASDPAVWRDILLANRAQVLAQAEQFKTTLFQFEAAMREGQADVIEQLIKEAAQGRGSWQPIGARDST